MISKRKITKENNKEGEPILILVIANRLRLDAFFKFHLKAHALGRIAYLIQRHANFKATHIFLA